MRITPDTNVLVRLITADDPQQHALARQAVESADVVAVSLSSLCELAWVLRSRYAARRDDVAEAIQLVINTHNVVLNRPAAEEGLRLLRSGGNFTDGVIAHEGRTLSGETFVSFDKEAVRLLDAGSRSSQLLR